MRAFLKNACLVFVSCLLGLAILEVALRAVDGLPLVPTENLIAKRIDLLNVNTLSVYDPILGWIIKPGFEARYKDMTFFTGEFGVRMNQDRILPLPHNAILASGDSFTAGSEVSDAQSWPAHLQQRLGIPVVNAAAGAWASDQIVLRAEQLLPKLSPATVIASFLVDDIGRAGYRVYGGGSKPYFTVESGALVPHNIPVVRLASTPAALGPVRAIFGYSDLVNTVMTGLGLGQRWWDTRQYVKADNDPTLVSCLLLKRLQAETAAAGVRLLFVLQFGGNEVIQWAKQPGDALAVLKCAADDGIETVDTWEPLKSVLNERGVDALSALYVMHGDKANYGSWGHMSSAGNDFVAELVAERLHR